MKNTFSLPAKYLGHKDAIYTLCKGIVEGTFISSGGDGWVVEWNYNNPEGILVAKTEANVFSLCVIPEKSILLAGDMHGGMHWIDLAHKQRIVGKKHHEKGLYRIAWDGHNIYTLGGDGYLSKWDLEKQSVLESIKLSKKALRSFAINPALRQMAIGDGEGKITLVDLTNFNIISCTSNAHADTIFSMAFFQNHLYTGGKDAQIKKWEWQSLVNEHFVLPSIEIPAHMATVNDLNTDGKYLFSASRDKNVKIWDLENLKLLFVIDAIRNQGNTRSVNCVAYLDGMLLCAGDDKIIRVYSFDS